MQLNVNDAQAIEVSELTFGGEFNETLVHQAVVAYMAAAVRAPSSRKPVPTLLVAASAHGVRKALAALVPVLSVAQSGVAAVPLSAARPQDHSQKLNKKMYRAAMRSILAELVRTDRLVVVQDFAVEAPKTKDLLNKLNGMGLSDVLIVSDAVDQNLYLAARKPAARRRT